MSFNPGDIVTVDLTGVKGMKRRPAVVLSSVKYYAIRPDTIVGLITTRTRGLGETDYELYTRLETSRFTCCIRFS